MPLGVEPRAPPVIAGELAVDLEASLVEAVELALRELLGAHLECNSEPLEAVEGQLDQLTQERLIRDDDDVIHLFGMVLKIPRAPNGVEASTEGQDALRKDNHCGDGREKGAK